MFCKYCGKPIDEGSMRCKICGRPVGQLEGGNGFWDLKEDRQKAPEEAAAPAPAAPTPAASQDAIPTAAAASPADAKSMRELRGQVKKLQEELKAIGPQKRNALAAAALLLGLLALALGAFVLYQMRSLSSQVQALSEQTAELSSLVQLQDRKLSELEAKQEEGGLPTVAEARWQGFDELEGVQLFSAQELFSGPNKGENDLRGQSIKLGPPDLGYEKTTIFTALFQGPAGTYKYYWVRVEGNDATMETYFTPLKEEDGYAFTDPLPSDANQRHYLSIMGDVKEEHLGRYAFVALETQTRSAYVSGIVELYDRAEQTGGLGG